MMQKIAQWGGPLERCMKAVSQMFKMNRFKIGADNCDTAQIVGNTKMLAEICEGHARTVLGKTLDQVMEPQPNWKTDGYCEDIRNLWCTSIDWFLKALRNPHELLSSKPKLSITGGNGTKCS